MSPVEEKMAVYTPISFRHSTVISSSRACSDGHRCEVHLRSSECRMPHMSSVTSPEKRLKTSSR